MQIGSRAVQMRELEILLGLESEERVGEGDMAPLTALRVMAERTEVGKLAWARIESATEEQTLRSALRTWLYRTPIQGSGPSDADDAASVETHRRGLRRLAAAALDWGAAVS